MKLRVCAVAVALAAAAGPSAAAEPLPLELAVTLRAHSSGDLSPDGQWFAQAYTDDHDLQAESRSYTATGVPLSGGAKRQRIRLVHLPTSEVLELTSDASSSWAPVWSPDGEYLAYYSDERGAAGLWLWEKDSRRATRFPGAIVRPFYGYEAVSWLPDSRRLICKILPQDLTVAQANELGGGSAEAESAGSLRFPKIAANEPSVITFSTAVTPADAAIDRASDSLPQFANRSFADLALLDIRDRSVTRIVERARLRWYGASPDGTQVAYSLLKRLEPDSQQLNYDIVIHSLMGGGRREAGKDIRLGYGNEVSWSPDGRFIAYITTGPLAAGECLVFSLTDGAVRRLGGRDAPSFNVEERAPLWGARGDRIYLPAKGTLWRLDAKSGAGSRIDVAPDAGRMSIVTARDRSQVWSRRGKDEVWLATVGRSTGKGALYRVDPRSGKSQRLFEGDSALTPVDASGAGEILLLSNNQTQARQARLFDTRTGQQHGIPSLNPGLDRYPLGQAQVIEWAGKQGQTLRGALLLPPGHEKGQRHPLVVWVYEGANNSASVNTFGLVASPQFNFQILATRGYAVFFPDAPLHEGTPMPDLMDTVMPGIDRVIELGYADAQRLAVMGNSYGSYCTLALISQTGRFKAAVISAVVDPDLVGGYLQMNPDGSARNTGYYEQGQGNMGGTPWQYPERYRTNSPVFAFDRIRTPVLIAHGTKDFLPLRNPASVFVALRRLGQQVEYNVYENEGHGIQRTPNVLHFWQRRLVWLDRYVSATADESFAAVSAARDEFLKQARDSTLAPREIYQRSDNQAKVLQDRGRSFLAAFPDDPRRLQVLSWMLKHQPYFIEKIGPVADEKDSVLVWGAIVRDISAAAAWRRERTALLQDLNRIEDVSPQQVDERARLNLDLIIEDAYEAQSRGETVAIEPLRNQLDRWLEKISKPDQQLRYVQRYLYMAEAAGWQKAQTEWRSFLNSPNPQVRALAEAKLGAMPAAKAPVELSFTALDGRKVDLAQLRGKVVLIDFWATWCIRCIDELPNLRQVYRDRHAQGFEIVGISLDSKEDEQKLRTFVEREQIPWPQHFAGEAEPDDNPVSARFAVKRTPTMFLLDKSGVIVSTNARGEGLVRQVDALLKQ